MNEQKFDAKKWLKRYHPEIDGINEEIILAIVELLAAKQLANNGDIWDAFYSWSNGVDDDTQFKIRMNALFAKQP